MASYIEQLGDLSLWKEKDRLKTFTIYEWPNHRMLPEVLASCGFYYEGYKDQVTCYQCDIAVSEWEGNEDVWFVHVKANPFCNFLLCEKETDFIRHCFNLPIPQSLSWTHECFDEGSPAEMECIYDNRQFRCTCKLRGHVTQSQCMKCKRNYPRSQLLPCGHTPCCKYCSSKLKCCLVCKCPISFRLNPKIPLNLKLIC